MRQIQSRRNTRNRRARLILQTASICTVLGASLVSHLGLRVAYASGPPTPTYGTAVVDGNDGEWDLTSDYYAPMYLGGDPTKSVLANGYLRYDCSSATLYVLVLQNGTTPLLSSPTGNAWAALNGGSGKHYTDTSGNDGTPPDFAWIGLGYSTTDSTYAQGYEASMPLSAGSYTIVVHVEALASGTASTVGFVGFNPRKTSAVVNVNVSCSGITFAGISAFHAHSAWKGVSLRWRPSYVHIAGYHLSRVTAQGPVPLVGLVRSTHYLDPNGHVGSRYRLEAVGARPDRRSSDRCRAEVTV